MNRLITIVAAVTLGLPLCAQAQLPSPQRTPDSEGEPSPSVSNVPPSLVGRWRSLPADVVLSSDVDRDVYGPNAVSSRVAEVVITSTGEGTLTVSRRVVDRRGRTVAGTRSIEEVHFVIGAADRSQGGLPRYPGKVIRAERRYPDPPADRFTLEGGAVEFYRAEEGKADELLLHFDAPDGNGSFSDTLKRQPAVRRSAT